MPRGEYLTEEKKQRIINDVRCGMKQKEAAEKHGVGVSTVAKLVHDYKMREAAAEIGENDREEQGGFVFAEGMTGEQRAQYTADVFAQVEGAAPCCENAAANKVRPDGRDVNPAADTAAAVTREVRPDGRDVKPAADTAAAVTHVETLPKSSAPAGGVHITPEGLTAYALPKSSAPDGGISENSRLTVKQLIRLHWTDDILFFYEDEPGVKDGKWDFSGTELFLAYHSSVWVESMLRPEVLARTVRRIYNDDGVIRILVDSQKGNDL